jgi:signal transduction histidine kinase
LRDILGVNRAAIFLRQPAGGFTGTTESRVLKSACSVGLAPGLLEHFELSFDSGIGGYLHRRGRILRVESPEAQADVAMRKEFELLGTQAAIPILDRESLVGVAVFDGRVTGEPLINGELELVFHLLEELGLAVKNIWLHGQLANNHEMMTGVLRELSSACVVVGRDLDILHANKAARQMFGRSKRASGGELEFSDLPQLLGSKVYQVLKTGAGIATFKHTPAELPNAVHSVTVVPFRRAGMTVPDSALLVVEDHTQAEQLRKLETEAAGLRLIKSMADRIAHEVGNAMVPLSTHQQLLGERYRDAEFRASLDQAMSEGVKRVNRLINQMRFLARDAVVSRENMPLAQLLEEAFKEAHRHQPARSAKLQFENGGQPVVLAGDRAALRHALSEVLLNAIQANPSDPKVRVTTSTDSDGQGHDWVHIDVLDTGTGFTPEAAQKVPTPFFTTRTVGLGLGLCVARKVLETHQGRLSIFNPTAGQPNSVRLTLPLAAPAAN